MIPAPVKYLCELFHNRGHQIRIVGGWVRDTLRGVCPKDLDLCTTALPEEVVELCRQNGLRCIETGFKHGTVSIAGPRPPDPPGSPGLSYYGPVFPVHVPVYEVTTLRVDTETDGRHATVEFTTDWRADAARRDFTINAMSMDHEGNLYDYFGGREHLRRRRVIFVGDPGARMQEDYLRILRYFRFRGRIGDHMEDRETERHLYEHAPGLRLISGERIWMEMQQILSGQSAAMVLCGLFSTHVLDYTGIHDATLSDIQRASVARRATDNPVTVLAALTAEPLAERWKLSRDEASLLRWLQAARLGRPPYMAELKDIATTKGLGKGYAIEWAAMFGPAPNLDDIRVWEVPEFPVRGADIVDTGIPEGTEVGLWLRRLELIWKCSGYQMSRESLLLHLRHSK